MPKIRTPLTIEAGLDRAVGLMTAECVAQAIGKSVGLVRKFADPDEEANNVQLRQAIAIDRACMTENGEAPLLAVYQRLIDGCDAPDSEEPIHELLLTLHVTAGRLTERLQAATAPGGPGGERITAAERAEVMAEVHALRARCDALERICAREAEPERLVPRSVK